MSVTTTMTPSESSKPLWNPHNYQKDGIKLCISQACAGLLFEPGLGKTSTILAAFNLLKRQGINQRALIVAPLRVIYSVWPTEIRKWQDFGNLRFAILHGDDKNDLVDAEADIFLINPDGLKWLATDNRWRRIKCDVLVVDESTQFKNSSTQRFKTLRNMLNLFKRRYILTGTPAPNGLLDLFGQIYILDQGNALGRFITHYRNEYFYPSGFGGYKWSPKLDTPERIAARIDPLVMRLKAKDWLELPELINTTIHVDLDEAARRAYRQVENTFFTIIGEEEIEAPNAAAAGSKCRQIANGAVYPSTPHVGPGPRPFQTVHRAKLEALQSLVEELQGQPLLVLYEFDHDRQQIESLYPGVPYIGGGVSAKRSDELVDLFNKGMIPVLLGHPASMRFGLNLQGSCANVCWYGMTWNLEHYDQATKRVHRQGQEAQRVVIHHIVARDTLDEDVMATLASKDRTQESFLGRLRSRATR